MQGRSVTPWWSECIPFYGISVFLTPVLLPQGAAPCCNYCCNPRQSSCSLVRCTLASCKQPRGECSQVCSQSSSAPADVCCWDSAPWAGAGWLQSRRARQRLLPLLLFPTYSSGYFCHVFIPGEKRVHRRCFLWALCYAMIIIMTSV